MYIYIYIYYIHIYIYIHSMTKWWLGALGGLEFTGFPDAKGLSTELCPDYVGMVYENMGAIVSQWIGLREKLQEGPIFHRKIYGFL